jgi:hypothetical protein
VNIDLRSRELSFVILMTISEQVGGLEVTGGWKGQAKRKKRGVWFDS